MKIEVLRLGNLNSLKGDHEIRFDQSPLADTGLFAIVGETGAGKTTLLDAITLALYGQIDREKENKGGGLRIISWGTVACYAELEFTSGQERYLCRWERQRAHKKIDGKLKAAVHQLSIWDKDDKQWKFLSEKVSETQKLVPQVCGLNYDRFTRSVMLPQGAFARFLLADENKRADLLEQITGTEIYRAISIAAYERHKLSEQSLEEIQQQLSSLQLLSETEKDAIHEILNNHQQTLAAYDKKLEKLLADLGLYKQQKERTTEQRQLAQKLVELNQTKAKQATERKQLEDSDNLNPIAEQIRSYTNQQIRLQQIKQSSSKLKTRQQSLQNGLEAAKKNAEDTAQQLQRFLDKKNERDLKIDRAIGLESRLKEQHKELQRLRQAVQSVEKEIGNNNQLVQDTQKALTQLAADTKELRQQLGSILSLEQLDVLDKIPLLLQEKLATSLVKKEAISQQLQQAKMQLQYSNLVEKQKLEQQAKKLQDEQLRLAKDAEQSALKQQEQQQQLLQQLLQSQQLSALKSSLSDGDACPVCGSVEHPALAHWQVPPDNLIEQQRQSLQQAEEALRLNRQKRENADKLLAGIKQRQATQKEQIEQLNLEWSQRFEQAIEATALDIETLKRSQQDQVQQTKQLEQLIKTCTEIVGKTSQQDLSTKLEQYKQALTKAQQLHQQEQSNLAAVESTSSKIKKELQELLGGMSAEAARQQLNLKGQQYQQAVEQAQNLLNEQRSQITQLDSQFQLLQAESEKLNQDNERLVATTATLLNKYGIASIDIASKMLLSNEAAQQLRSRFDKLDRSIHASQTQLKQIEDKLKHVSTATNELAEEAVIKAEVDKLEDAKKVLYQETGARQQQLATDDQNKKKAGHLSDSLTQATAEASKWSALNELIGSAKGDRFSRFAQSLTLDRLVAAANEQLVGLLGGRYRIDRAPSVYKGKTPQHLGLEIIDTYQAENRRDTRTLSGGESFLVSLALALGLSDLAGGNTHIQSLFIDEGFGSLDEGLLDTVIDTLENLQAKGKTIGLISHVKELRERIYHKIVVEKKGDGFSKLVIC